MFDSTSQKNRISIEAFIEQIENWQLTLSREQKKLRLLRTKLKSKILINQLDILVTQMDGQLIRYRKIKNKDSNKIESSDIIQYYNTNSKRFMDIMENVGNFADKVDTQGDIQFGDQFDLEGFEIQSRNNLVKQKYQDQTFTYTISKQEKFNKIDNTPFRNSSKPLSKKNSTRKDQKIITNYKVPVNSHNSTNPNLTLKANQHKTNSIKGQKNISFSKMNQMTQGQSLSVDEFDSWEIKYQLKQIKSMMIQIQNQIKYHNHQDIEIQMSKVQHKNKKMSLQLKSLKEDSQYIMTRIQKLKQQLGVEKQIQSQMIQQFENPQKMSRKKTKSLNNSNSVQNSRKKSNKNDQQQVSDWVKVRI